MTYRVIRSRLAEIEIDRFGILARGYSDQFAEEQFLRLDHVFSVVLREAPDCWPYFFITGAPYRAYLFEASRRMNYWIVYTVDETARTVNVLRFWHASQNPEAFEL